MGVLKSWSRESRRLETRFLGLGLGLEPRSLGLSLRGVYTRGGNGARCTMAKNGGNVMIMMLLLVSVIIYYYINRPTFITLHQCTFNLLFALFLY